MFGNNLKGYRLATIIGLGLVTSTLGSTAFAGCQYVVTNSWSTGFTAAVKITNDTSATVNGWQVSWAYSKNTVANAWNATLSGSNPYNAKNLSWNSTIQPGQTVEFGFQGSKPAGAAVVPVVTGAICQ